MVIRSFRTAVTPAREQTTRRHVKSILHSHMSYKIFPLASVSRPALGPTQPPVQWVPGVLSPGIKARPGRDADHSPPSSVDVENEYELYVLSPQVPPWRVAGLLYLLHELQSHKPATHEIKPRTDLHVPLCSTEYRLFNCVSPVERTVTCVITSDENFPEKFSLFYKGSWYG
jgi:hypothetical protein